MNIPMSTQIDGGRSKPGRNRHRSGLLIVILAAAGLAGCGYALVGRGSNVPLDVTKVFIRPFANMTAKVQVEQFVTQAVASELVTRQRFEVVNDLANADAELSGTVTGGGLVPVSFDETGRATEYEVSIVAKVQFQRRDADNTTLWSSDRYAFREAYPVAVSELEFYDQESLALEEAAKKFAETMVSDLLEGF